MQERKRFEDIKRPLEERGYETIKSIGKGAFGEVLLVKNKKDKQQKTCAIKVISKTQIKKKPFLQKYIDQQIHIMRELNHPNIVRQECSFHSIDYIISASDFIVIVMEFCETGNLLTYQSKLPGKVFPLDNAIKVIVEVMKGLKTIHEKNFIHRDIKSENVLLKKVPNSQGSYDIVYKIADFGFARSIGGVGAKTHCGTQKYMAPEILSNSYYGIAVDIWAIGVLFYFMLFAEYPFKGHDMKTEIIKKCSPAFSLQATVTKREKLKQMNSHVEDFFKRIFVVDPKKRIKASEIIIHPLFQKYYGEVKENENFYKNFEKNEPMMKDDLGNIPENGYQSQMEPEDDTRKDLLRKKDFDKGEKHLERELEEISFEIQKVLYLRDCANEMFENYSSYLTYAERLAARFYLLKAYLFYSDPLTRDLSSNKMPQQLAEANISSEKFTECTKTEFYHRMLNKLQEENMRAQIEFEDTYDLVQDVLQHMPIRNFEKGYTRNITEKKFDELKFSYRSTTSYIFKSIHENRKIESHLRNKIKIRLFCCHMINRIFNRKQIGDHFPYFKEWLAQKKINYSHTFDFIYFRRWILEESQENLEKNISLLHKTFF